MLTPPKNQNYEKHQFGLQNHTADMGQCGTRKSRGRRETKWQLHLLKRGLSDENLQQK